MQLANREPTTPIEIQRIQQNLAKYKNTSSFCCSERRFVVTRQIKTVLKVHQKRFPCPFVGRV